MEFSFSSNSILDTDLNDCTGSPVYHVETSHGIGNHTTTITRVVSPGQWTSVGEIDWKLVHHSTIRFNGNEYNATPDGQEYRWKMKGGPPVVRQPSIQVMSLFTNIHELSLNDDTKTPVAKYQASLLRGKLGKSPPVLQIFPSGEGIADLVVLTFLYLEKVRRDSEKVRNVTDVSAGMTGVGGLS
ncbi:hypothetical protein C8J56DRAFT_1100299 [Mycena floridula]|nr:hypothetical protein C8J56DRAFT_1100299 [Mycena floridula]